MISRLRLPSSLGARLSLAAAVAVAVAVALASTASYFAVRAKLRGEVDQALESQAQAVDKVVQVAVPGLRLEPERRFVLPPQPFGGAAGYGQLISAEGALVKPGSGGETLPVSDKAREVAAGIRGGYFSDENVEGTHVRVLTEPLDGGLAVQLARPLSEVDRTLSSLRALLFLITGAGVLFAAVLGWFVSRTALVPVRRFTSSTEAVTGQPVGRRLAVAGDDELGRLARSFNTTLEALESSVESQRQLVADASHELRTPIASLRTNIQVLARDEKMATDERERLMRDVVLELDELTALVGDVVDLARGVQPDELTQELRLDELTAASIDKARRRAPDVRFEARLEPVVVYGDPTRLGRAIDNLLDNAVKWNAAGEPVEVTLAGGRLGVRDHGAGIPDGDLPHVFDRFYRSSDARSMPGSGLGLAIVRQVAESHGAAVSASNAAGGGALFELVFPPMLVARPAAELSAPPHAQASA
jgi:two-component system, OmpR family, sensor histidine kinase MprB